MRPLSSISRFARLQIAMEYPAGMKRLCPAAGFL